MSRFASTPEKLEQDVAMIAYRKKTEGRGGWLGPDAAEWIEALHQEHWRTLRLLRQSEGERVAGLLADIQIVLCPFKRVDTDLGVARTMLGDVLGDTVAVQALREVARDQRHATEALEAITRKYAVLGEVA